MRLELVTWSGDRAGSIDWDPERGTIDGPAADQVRELLEIFGGRSVHFGSAATFDVPDPLHSRRDMALLLAVAWRVPEELMNDLPPMPATPDDLAPGVVI
jgi:hypothetical protein